MCKKYNREKDLYVVSMESNIYYNPIDKGDVMPIVLASRLTEILEVLTKVNNSDTYWLDKAESLMCEVIKLIRYNNLECNFNTMNKILSNHEYLQSNLKTLKDNFISGRYTSSEVYEVSSIIDFFEGEYILLDNKVSSIIKSEVTRLIQPLVTSFEIMQKFCSNDSDCIKNFKFDILNNPKKIVVFSMNIAKYKRLAKIVATYLKLDFQHEVIQSINIIEYNKRTPIFFICDEYQNFITTNDSSFYALSREAKCINIVCQQSYTSLLSTIKDRDIVTTTIQNLVNKIWLRNDDMWTNSQAATQVGKIYKEIITNSISENAVESKYNMVNNMFRNKKSSISQSIAKSKTLDYEFSERTFCRELGSFEAIVFISDGEKIEKVSKVKLKKWEG